MIVMMMTMKILLLCEMLIVLLIDEGRWLICLFLMLEFGVVFDDLVCLCWYDVLCLYDDVDLVFVVFVMCWCCDLVSL